MLTLIFPGPAAVSLPRLLLGYVEDVAKEWDRFWARWGDCEMMVVTHIKHSNDNCRGQRQ